MTPSPKLAAAVATVASMIQLLQDEWDFGRGQTIGFNDLAAAKVELADAFLEEAGVPSQPDLRRREPRQKTLRELAAVPRDLRWQVLKRDNYTCKRCGSDSGEKLTIDHIMPVSKGGQSVLENLQTLCRSCNCSKGVRV